MNLKANLLLGLLLLPTLAWADECTLMVSWTVEQKPGYAIPTGVKAERRISGGAWTEIKSLDIPVTSFEDTVDNPPPGGVTYCYRLRAFNATASSPYSQEVCFQLPPSVETIPVAPSGLTAKTISPTEVRLTWIDRSINETGFVAQIVGIAPIRVEDVANANEQAAVVGNMVPGAFYSLRVAAINSAGRSIWTRAVYVRMPRK